ALLPLQAPGARHQLRNRQAAGFVDIERQRLQLDRAFADLLEIQLADAAAADVAGWYAATLGENTGGELLAAHFAGEEADRAAIDRLGRAVGLQFRNIGPGNVVGDVGRQRGLAHAGTAGDDDQVGRLQAAHLGVEVAQAGGDAGKLSVALERLGRHVDGNGERRRDLLDPAIISAGLGQFVQPPFRILDLVARREVDRRVIGDVDHL